ncbi:hypothetical protein KEM54_001245 [Ascosphaera aggregata]|nr:hypothetical protein KEM54_001245 [Ascosphaera aggregata]
MPAEYQTRSITRSQGSTFHLEVEKTRLSTMLARGNIRPLDEIEALSSVRSHKSSLASSLGDLSLETPSSKDSTYVDIDLGGPAIVAINNGQPLMSTRRRTRSQTSASSTSSGTAASKNYTSSNTLTSTGARQQNRERESAVPYANGNSWLQSSLYDLISPGSDAVSLKQETLMKSKKGRRKPNQLGLSSDNNEKNGTKAKTKRSRPKRVSNEESQQNLSKNGEERKARKLSNVSTAKSASKRKRSASCDHSSSASSNPSDSVSNVTFIPLAEEPLELPALPTVGSGLQLLRNCTEALTQPALPEVASEDERDITPEALTWQDHEITGFEADPDDPDDQLGLDGIGFKREGAQEAAIIARRKKQVLDYERREQAEERERRLLRRRERSNNYIRVSKGNKDGLSTGNQRDDGDTGSETSRKRVKFADEVSRSN